MSGSSSVPQATFGPTGFIPPAESAILAGVQADINAAMGGNVNPALTTPQGQFASSITAITGDANDQFCALANGVDPAFASGRYQDAIGRIYFLERLPAEPTSVTGVVCTGLPGTVLAPGAALAQDPSGNLYTPTSAGTIASGGSVTMNWQCTVNGPTPLAANTLSLYNLVPGWNTISNPNPGVTGVNVESRADFENRRQNSVAANALGTLPAIQAAALSVPNVIDALVRDNPTNANVSVGPVVLLANSVYVVVAGGATQAVANAIWTKKPPGCNWTGSTTATVQDTTGYNVPYPSYTVAFDFATAVPIYIAVSIPNTTQVPSNALALIQAAVIAAFAGADGGSRARINSELFASRYYYGIASLGAWAQIINLYIGTSSSPTGSTVQMNLNQIPTISAGNITLTLV